jgi:DNA-directed RNA polymerase beta' subunit
MINNIIKSIIPLKTVSKIQYSILSDKDKLELSVVNETDMTGFEAGVYIKGSPYDLATGTITDNERCGTCKLSQKEDPGHFGHIELARLVCNPLYIIEIEKILKCICFTCGNILVPEIYHTQIEKISKNRRLTKCKEYSKDKICNICNREGKNGNRIINNPSFNIKNDTMIFYKKSSSEKSIFLPCEIIKDLFKLIKDNTIILMGFNPRNSRPENLIMGIQLVPPPTIRPTVERSAGKKSEDNLFKLISEIIKKNEKLKLKIKKYNIPINELTVEYEDLIIWISFLMTDKLSNKGSTVTYATGGAPIKSIKDIITGKEGLIRESIMGKRVNYSARSVISPEVNTDIDQIAIPKQIAKILTYPEIVNENNFNKMIKLIRNGSEIYPGANVIESVNTGKRRLLTKMTKEMIEDVIKNLSYGDKIKRHLIDGDYIMFNRQPTLHKYSIMAYTIKILENNHTIRLPLPVTEAHNADFDGDESNLHLPINLETVAEAKYLMMARNHIINMSNSEVLISLIQDNVLGLYLMTKMGDKKINRDIFMTLLASSRYFNIDKIPKNKKEFELIECINNILPNDFHIPSLNIKNGKFYPKKNISEKNNKSDDDNNYIEKYRKISLLKDKMNSNEILMKDSTIETISDEIYSEINENINKEETKYFVLNKNNIKNKIIKKIFINYGPDIANNIIISLQKLTNKFLTMYGFTCSIKDIIVDEKLKNKFQYNISKAHNAVNDLLEGFNNGSIKTPSIKKVYENYESKIEVVEAPFKMENAKLISDYVMNNPNHNFSAMLHSGSKGKITNILEINVEIGNQSIKGKRIMRSFGTGRSFPHFTKFEESPKSRGSIPNSYSDGMDAIDFFTAAAAGRAGLMDTSLGVRKTGYLERRLVKSLEDINCTYDNLVTRVDGKIIQYMFGGTNFNPIYLETNYINLINMNNKKLIEEFL